MNLIKAYNRLFSIINTSGETYYSGSQFLDLVSEVNEDTPTYMQLINQRRAEGKSTSRKDYYLDILLELNEADRLKVFKLFIGRLEEIAPEKAKKLKEFIFEESPGPTATIPDEVWNADRLTGYLEKMDSSITEHNYNYTLTLAYTCLEGFYKAFILSKIPEKKDLNELNPMAKAVRDYIRDYHLKTGISCPEQIVNSLVQ